MQGPGELGPEQGAVFSGRPLAVSGAAPRVPARVPHSTTQIPFHEVRDRTAPGAARLVALRTGNDLNGSILVWNRTVAE